MDSISVVLAADDTFAMPLAVAALSVILSFGARSNLVLYVLDMGIRVRNRKRVERTLRRPGVELRWVDSFASKAAALSNTWPNVTRATYARLFIPDVLPSSTKRALYIDCDVIARRSIADFFEADMCGALAMGVPDVRTPFVSSPGALPWWFRNGRAIDDLNFNTGVLLMDLDGWRKEKVGRQALDYLTGGRDAGRPQEALNAVIGPRIRALDPRWNVQSELADRGYESALPYTDEQLATLHQDPWLVHFSNARKPWHHGCTNPWCQEWYGYARQTAFHRWKPSRRKDFVSRARRLVRRGVDELSA